MKLLLCLLIVFLSVFSQGQNLILNSSFEAVNYCETKIPCSPVGWYSVSNIPYGYENDLPAAFNGKHSLAFLIAFEKEFRSYWQTRLLCNLTAGAKYIVSFELYPRNSEFEEGFFGACLSDTFFHSKEDTLMQAVQQVVITAQNVSSVKNGWYKITLPYVATGKEEYLLLGNFNKSSNKNILAAMSSHTKYIEYYVDNVDVNPAEKRASKCIEYKERADSLYSDNKRHESFDQKAEDIVVKSEPVMRKSKTDTLILDKLNFGFASDKLLQTKALNRYFDTADISTMSKIEIVGFTDSLGSASYNLDLSQRRANTVANYLIDTYRIIQSLITATGKGIVKDEKNLESNRKVEVKIYRR